MSGNPSSTGSGAFSRIVIWGFAAVGLLAAAAVIFLALSVSFWDRDRRPEPAPIQAGADAADIFSISQTNPLPGTRFDELVVARFDARTYDRGSYSSGGKEVDERNVILLDSTNGVSRKLLPDNTRRIVGRTYLRAVAGRGGDTDADGYEVKPAETPGPPLAYYVIEVEAVDGKSRDVLIGDLGTGRQAMLLRGIDGVDRVWMQSPTRMGVLMRQGRKLQYRAIEIPDLKIVAQQQVAID